MTKGRIQKALKKILSQDSVIHDMSVSTGVMMSMTKEEMSAMMRYRDVIKFNAGIQAYDEILYVLRKDRTKFGKGIFKKILATRNKIAKEYRADRRRHEKVFREKKNGRKR